MNRENFGEMIAIFVDTYEKQLTDRQLDIYYNVLEEIPDKEINKTTKECLRRYKYFPKPAEIWEAFDFVYEPLQELPPLTKEEWERCKGDR